jgi:hypothetical protein
MQYKPLLSFFVLGTLALTACQSSEIANSKDVDAESVYFSYQVSHQEGDADVSCVAQYRFGGNKGTTLLLQPPSKVRFDGATLRADSGRIAGAYYETKKPVGSFAGEHTWEFTDLKGKTYTETFRFRPFALAAPIPPVLERKDWSFRFEGLENGDLVRISIADTAFSSENISREFTVQNNQVTIPLAEIKPLSAGPLRIDISRHEESQLKEKTREGGILTIDYQLKRVKSSLMD